jgi:cobalt-zinc-cadmium efflux system outer membrane protein
MKHSILLSFLLSLHSIVVSAASVSTENLIATALANNPEIQYYQAQIEAARGGRVSAAQIANPDLSISAGAMHLSPSPGSPAGNGAVWRVEFSQVLDFPGRIALKKAIADHDLTLAQLGLDQFKNQLANAVRAHAGEVALLTHREAAAETVRERLAALIEVMVARDPGTVSARLERRILEASLLNSDRILTDVEKERREATATLAVLCGKRPGGSIEVPLPTTSFPTPPALDGLMQQAAKTNFDLQQKRVYLARQGLNVDLSKSERWGNISFGPYVGAQTAGQSQVEGGIGFSVPLPLWNRNKGNIQIERAKLQQAETLITTTLRDLERDLSIAVDSYSSELKALERWRPESEKEFAEAAKESDEHFRLGAVPAATYVEMQRGYLDAIDSLIQCRRNAWAHQMEIERLTGTTLGKEAKQ